MAVAAGGRAGETAMLVGEVDRQAVDLELAQVACGPAPQCPVDAGGPVVEFLAGEGVVEAVHALGVDDLGEQFGVDAAAHMLGRRVGAAQLGEALLDVFEFAHEGVELGIGDRRGVLHVVALAVLLDLQGQLFGARPRRVELPAVCGRLGDIG